MSQQIFYVIIKYVDGDYTNKRLPDSIFDFIKMIIERKVVAPNDNIRFASLIEYWIIYLVFVLKIFML